MKNVITKEEMLEQFGDTPLNFSLYSNKQFVFQGTSGDIDIMLMLNADIIYEICAGRYQTINSFAEILQNEKTAKFIKIRISHNFANVYQN